MLPKLGQISLGGFGGIFINEAAAEIATELSLTSWGCAKKIIKELGVCSEFTGKTSVKSIESICVLNVW